MQEDKAFSPQESLALIQTMISKTKDSFADNTFYFLFWGWLVLGCCLVSYSLKVYLHYPNHFYIWWLMPFVTGSLIRFKPLIMGGLINFVLAVVSIRFGYDNQLLIGALAIVISCIISGHLLRARLQKNTSQYA